jgi:hypothetical protein
MKNCRAKGGRAQSASRGATNRSPSKNAGVFQPLQVRAALVESMVFQEISDIP